MTSKAVIYQCEILQIKITGFCNSNIAYLGLGFYCLIGAPLVIIVLNITVESHFCWVS